MYDLPYYGRSYWIWNEDPAFNNAPKFFKTFFQNPMVVVLGTNMTKVAKRLEVRHRIEIKNPFLLFQMLEQFMHCICNRVDPSHKRMLVETLQHQNEVVHLSITYTGQ
ncbi:hypothetical protein M0R45_036186 [Rubus argutus]|uniref:Uncharacterized protein n=1 Tax=Rubus argutus TaxID=59490 RepID=A0AAW1VY41_RUBAR